MPKLNTNKILEMPEVDMMLDPLAFEKYCGSCVYFETEECPHLNKVTSLTTWQTEIQCNKFYD